jgi:hypothetical protein
LSIVSHTQSAHIHNCHTCHAQPISPHPRRPSGEGGVLRGLGIQISSKLILAQPRTSGVTCGMRMCAMQQNAFVVLMFECLHAMCNRVCLVVDGAAHDRDRDDAHPPHLVTAASHACPLISSLPTGTQNGRIGGAQITSVKSNGYGSSRPLAPHIACNQPWTLLPIMAPPTHRTVALSIALQPSMNSPADDGTSHSSHCRTVNRIATIHELSCR